jgi:hypothetical protein
MTTSPKVANDARRSKVLNAVHAGKLPTHPPERTWGGKGSGAPCVLCEEPIRPNEIEWELEFSRVSDTDERANFRVHPDCLTDWQLARLELARTLPTAPAGVTFANREEEASSQGGRP